MSTDDDPTPKPDPFQAARAALEMAREARRAAGQVVDDEPLDLTPKSPEQVLEEARLIRESAGQSPAQRQREDAARAELARLKAGGGDRDRNPDGDADQHSPTPKKRNL